jgi:hypothetical protein
MLFRIMENMLLVQSDDYVFAQYMHHLLLQL